MRSGSTERTSEGGRYKSILLAGLGGEVAGGARGGGGDGGLGSFAVEGAVHVGVAEDNLDVFAGFGEGDGLDEFGNFVVSAFGFPEGDAVDTSVVGGSGAFRAAGGAGEIGDVEHAQLDV